MATQQAYQAYAQSNKGTLVPGQTISVNKYTVQVERYLSQGGFAHVYLVRTPQPVYGTTHHVLKRIAVANEAMLSEVKKEVDVMRALKGHPNIVHLIDAAWHRMPNATYEVFILMEFCPGGGIIDMMNRRLRERLTEAEILQIFVDVCEGVAYMHNSRPPLLHRDLKVENILQSSATSYKLCDFGSAATVSRPPTNTQEIRALEADIGRHTTMQYRAPEMIDLYSKRPIDEKSDVWALGVLLYKLCYYTTPFEEHGSLAILNVQYRIPPYPVYSSQMNMLIGSMLREHGTQRPTVFELLNHVHYLRGTKSQFTYTIPVPQQPIPPRQQQAQKPPVHSHPAPSNYATIPPASNSPRNAYSSSPNPQPNAGAQARDKVLEAIAPMRRGRPTKEGSTSRPSSRAPSPQRSATIPPSLAGTPPVPPKDDNWLDNEEAAWKTMSAQAKAREKANALFDGAWKVSGAPAKRDGESPRPPTGFNDDFGEKLWRSTYPNVVSPPVKSGADPMSLLKPSGTMIKPLAYTGNEKTTPQREKDAFEGLGLMSNSYKPAPTLAEARKLRTGLAVMNTHTHQRGYNQSESLPRPPNQSPSARPTPSPRPSYLSPTGLQGGPAFISPSHSPVPTGSSWQNPARASPSVHQPSSSSNLNADGTPIESRFPSIEEIDAQLGPAISLYPSSTQMISSRGEGSRFASQPKSSSALTSDTPPQLPPRPKPVSLMDEVSTASESLSIRSAPVAKEPTSLGSLQRKFDTPPASSKTNDWKSASFRKEVNDTPSWHSSPASRQDAGEAVPSSSLNPPAALHTKRSSMTMKYALEGASPSAPSLDTGDSRSRSGPREDKYSRSPKPPPRDWLTGDDDDHTSVKQQNTRGSAVLRDTPAKRASVILQNDFKFPKPVAAQHDTTPILQPLELPSASSAEVDHMPIAEPLKDSPTVSRFTKAFPPIDLDTDVEPFKATSAADGFTDNWSPIASKAPYPPRLPPKQTALIKSSQKASLDSTSSAEDDDGPEDLGGLNSRVPQKVDHHSPKRRKGRQSSVHDLVDLWGGGLGLKDKPKDSVEEKKPSKPRPTSLMPPLSGGLSGKFGGIGSGNVSPRLRLSPTQRDPSPVSAGYKPTSMFDATKERSSITSPSLTTSTSTSSSPANVGGRSRPQSMFLFPSKSSEGLNSIQFPTNRSASPQPPLASPSLPEDEKVKTPVRRPSISSVVQRYEAIGGKVITPQVIPSTATGRVRTLSTKTTGTGGLEHTRVKVFPTPDAPTKAEGTPSKTDTSNRDDIRSTKATGLSSVSAATNTREPEREPIAKPVRTRTMSSGAGLGPRPAVSVGLGNGIKGDYEPGRLKGVTTAKISPVESKFKPEPFSPRVVTTSTGTSASPATKDISTTQPISFSQRKLVLPLEEVAPASSAVTTNLKASTSSGTDELSSSPEKPYQGVGRLIDQWQRKTESKEAKSSPGMVKRAGLVGTSNRL